MTLLMLTAGETLPALEIAVDEPVPVDATVTAELYAGPDRRQLLDVDAPAGGSTVTVVGFDELERGAWQIIVQTSTASSTTIAVDDVVVLVEARDGWHTVATARAEWRDAPDDDARLFELLDVAREQCIAFMPAGLPTSSSVRAAQLLHARNVWNAERVGPGGDAGVDGFALVPHPLDWQVKQLLRPRRPRPVAT